MIAERIYIPSIDQNNAINAAAADDCTQKDMAEFYADCILADSVKPNGVPGVDWKAVNEAILKRWPKGLLRIKTAAWRLITKRKKAAPVA